jgi:hypothetical protein
MSAARFLTVAQVLTARCRVRRQYRLDTPGRALGSIPLIRFRLG